MEADRLQAIAQDPSTASTFDVGVIAKDLLRLRHAIRVKAALWCMSWSQPSAAEVADSFRRLVDGEDSDG